MLKLLDSLILPIVSYGIEVWVSGTFGFKALANMTCNGEQKNLTNMANDQIEKLHLAILKWTLGVGKATSNAGIWGDCGSTPLVVRYVKQITDFFNRLAKMDQENSKAIVRHAFAEQKSLGLGWFSTVTNTLDSLDMNKLECQSYNSLLCQERARNRFIMMWEVERKGNRKLTFYNDIKKKFETEHYLKIPSRSGGSCIAKFRMSAHKLKVETGRYGERSWNPIHRLCEFCTDLDTMELLINLPGIDPIVEDEIHLLRTCPRYHQIRTNVQEPTKSVLFHDTSSLFELEHIMEMTKYLREVFKIRFPAKRRKT